MVMVEPIEEILIHIDPALDYGPDWMPTPAPPRSIPVLGARGDWSDVWDWVKRHAILPAGKPISDPFGTVALTQQMIDAAMGSVITGLSGFMNRSAALTIQAAAILDAAINNLDNKTTYNHMELSQRLDRIENVQNYIVEQVIPAIEHQFVQADHTALGYALHAIEYQQQWTTQNVLVPLVESLGVLKHDMLQVIDLKAEESHQISAQQVAGLGAKLAPAIAAAAASAARSATFVDECGQPMCDTMGPKTNLGKLLKGLSLAAELAAIADLLALTEPELARKLADVVLKIGGYIADFENYFASGTETLGDVLGNVTGGLL